MGALLGTLLGTFGRAARLTGAHLDAAVSGPGVTQGEARMLAHVTPHGPAPVPALPQRRGGRP